MSFDINKIIMESLQELDEAWSPPWSAFSKDKKAPAAKTETPATPAAKTDASATPAAKTEAPATPAAKTEAATPDENIPQGKNADAGILKKGYPTADAKTLEDIEKREAPKVAEAKATEEHISRAEKEYGEKEKILPKDEIEGARSAQRKLDEEEMSRAEKEIGKKSIKSQIEEEKELSAEAAKKAARHVAGSDAGVDTHLFRAINRTGQALGIKKAFNDKEAGETGVGTHLIRAGKRTLEAVRNNEPGAIAGITAAGIGAGLGALSLAKKLRKTKKAATTA